MNVHYACTCHVWTRIPAGGAGNGRVTPQAGTSESDQPVNQMADAAVLFEQAALLLRLVPDSDEDVPPSAQEPNAQPCVNSDNAEGAETISIPTVQAEMAQTAGPVDSASGSLDFFSIHVRVLIVLYFTYNAVSRASNIVPPFHRAQHALRFKVRYSSVFVSFV